jgi:tRNA A-37 threonylcarbamoyl transferase component Bud32
MSEREEPAHPPDEPTIAMGPDRAPSTNDERTVPLHPPALKPDPATPAAHDSPPGLGELDSLIRPQEGDVFLAHYRLHEEIGRGGMGTVYRARDTLLDRQVAVKVLAEELSANPELRDRFVREARIIARMSHPNLPQIHFVGRSEGRLFFAMEWIDGESLEALLRRGPVPVKRALGMIRQVAIGLRAAHQAGIVHRDIKPSNLIVTRDGVVKILDFGIARSTAFDAGATATGAFLGTPHYASPEQARGEKADHRSDIYSAGEVLFALLTGRAPFEGTNTLAVLTDRLLKPVPEIPPEIECGDEVRKLVRRMMAKDPADRHQSCEELQHEIEEAAPGELVPARMGSRAWAGMLDVLLIGLPIVAIWAIFEAITGYFPTTLLYDSVLGRVLLGLILLGWPSAYSVLLADREGRTVGQRTQGIRTATREAEAPTRRRLALRILTIWGPIALGMSIQTDWPPAAVDLGALGLWALLVHNIPWLFVQLWILVLLLMPLLDRKGRHLADMLSRTHVLETRRPWRESSAGTRPRGWFAPSLTSRRSLARGAVLLFWFALAVFVVRQLRGFQFNGLPDEWGEPGSGKVEETVVAGRPGWNRLLARFGHEFLGPDERMENPESISLQRWLFFPLIHANTLPSDTLRILNRRCGSRLTLVGDGFTGFGGVEGLGRWYYNNSSWTEEVAPSSPAEFAAWEEVRRKAYQGSYVHFLRALMHGRLKEEGFEVENPEEFLGLFRSEKHFLVVAWPSLRVRVRGQPDVKSILIHHGFLLVTTWGEGGGSWGLSGGWDMLDRIPTSVFIRFAAEQDSRWGRSTESIDQVLSLQ